MPIFRTKTPPKRKEGSLLQVHVVLLTFSQAYLFSFPSDSAVFFAQNEQRIGGTYLKAIYEQYTDASFSTKVHKPKHLGFLGPVIRAEVNDIIEVVFMNNVRHKFMTSSEFHNPAGQYLSRTFFI